MRILRARNFFVPTIFVIFIFLFTQIPDCKCAQPQVSYTLSYSVNGGGNRYSPPTVTYTSNGVQHIQILGSQVTTYRLDVNTQWSITNPLSGSLPYERWQTNQNTAGTANANQTIALVYYHQVTVQFGYNILKGGSGFSPPYVSYTRFGSAMANKTVTIVWVDYGSAYSYVNPLAGSKLGERWITAKPTGTVTSSTLITPDYYHQYYIVFDYGISGGGNPTAPSVKYIALGLDQDPLQANPSQSTWADAQSTYTYSPNPLTSSGTNERWQASTTPSGTVSSSTTIRPVYYHQLLLTLSYNILGGGSPSQPSFRAPAFGSNSKQALTTSPTNYWFDSGASWTEAGTLDGSSLTERWSTGQPITGVITITKTLSFNYYHQYAVTLNYRVSGGTGFTQPTVNIISFGIATSTNSTSNLWLDSGSSYNFQNPLIGSNDSERWYAATSTGNIQATGTIAKLYYHQFSVIFSFTTLYGGSPNSPSIKYVSLGSSSTQEVTSADSSTWADANTTYTYPQILLGGSDSERWLITPSVNGKITSSIKVSPTYLHQYYVKIEPSLTIAGSASQPSDWHNSTSQISIYPTAADGWRFEGWAGSGEGSYTGPLLNATFIVSAPITEKMIFYPGLKINANGWGYIAYTLNSSNATVNAGNLTTVYVPVGTTLGLSEHPNSFLYSFINWTGEVNSTSNFIILTINKPLNEQANFGYNYLLIGLIVGIEAAIVIIAYFASGGRSHNIIKLIAKAKAVMKTKLNRNDTRVVESNQ